MPVTITFRLNEEDKAHEISLDKLKTRIASSEIGPKALVCDRVLTNGEWWSLDNLNLFHTHSPIHYEAGGHLRKKQQMQEEKKYAKKVRDDWEDRVFTSLPDAFTESCLGFESFGAILTNREAIGVIRLIRRPAFGGIDGVTIIYERNEVLVLAASSDKNPISTLTASTIEQVNSEIPDWNLLSKDFFAREVKSRKRRVAVQSLLPPLNGWLEVKAAVLLAPDCRTPTLDGYTFFHSASDRDWRTASTWANPRYDLTPAQAKLVDAYKPFLPSILR